MPTAHRGPADLITRAEAHLHELHSALLEFSYTNGLFAARQSGHSDSLPRRIFTWGAPIQKFITVEVDDLYILTFKIEVRASQDNFGARSSKYEIVAKGLTAETLKAELTFYLQKAFSLGNSWSREELKQH